MDEGDVPRVRRATASDADAVADVYLRARHHAVPDIPPMPGPDSKVRAWLVGVVLDGGEVWLAETEGAGVVGVMLLEGEWIEQLYVDPAWTGRGIGAHLLDVAQRDRPSGLQLWTFQSNHRAHRFYERRGFVAHERTDGRGNPERAPDVRYVWRPADPATVAPYDAEWPLLFTALGDVLRRALGAIALRIDHIGSTAVPGLDAKPIIDVQISVAALEPVAPFRRPLEECGFVWRADNPELTKRYFREKPGDRRTHVHVRRAGSFSEQFALLFRDFLRADAEQAANYATLKHGLAHLLAVDRSAYVDAKGPFTWETIRRADEWAKRTGWAPGPSDA